MIVSGPPASAIAPSDAASGATLPDQVSAALRVAMRAVASSVAVVTAGQGECAAGMTATSVTSVSLDPALMLVCVNRSTRLHAAAMAAGGFRLHYLAAGQEAIANAFGSGHEADRFGVGDWDMDAHPAPRLRTCQSEMICTLRESVEAGSHTVLIGRVVGVHVFDFAPLLYQGGGYHRLAI
jgi:flavin reductase (DIM6/NTAB) family NADH-FMN oxidoreductase RutF